jgi:hypothetical protein
VPARHVRSLPLRIALGLFLSCTAAQAQQSAAQPFRPVDVQVIVLSQGAPGPEPLSITYRSKLAKGEAERDLKALAQALKQAVPRSRITTEAIERGPKAPRMTSIETTLSGLVDRTNGKLTTESFARTFRRFQRVKVTYFVYGAFQPRGRLDALAVPDMHVLVRAQAPVYDFDFRHGRKAPPPAPPRKPGPPMLTAALGTAVVVLGAAATGAIVFYLARSAREKAEARDVGQHAPDARHR